MNAKMNMETLASQGRPVSRTMAESVAMRIQDLRKKAIQDSFQDFCHSGHRLEFVAKVRGVEYIDDAKASNVNSTWFALENMTRPVVWIAGGKAQGVDFASLRALVRKKVKHIVCIGADNSPVLEAFSDLVPGIVQTTDMPAAVQSAYLLAEEGNVVLLSPACPSFDLFESYQDKGMQFKRAVCEL